MEPNEEQGGPDGSSLRPVSSLRSHWEKMNKPGDPPPAPASIPPVSRSPSPKPPPPPVPNTRPPPKTAIAPSSSPPDTAHPKPTEGLAANHGHPPLRSPVPMAPPIKPKPPVAPKPVRPPAVLVEPPQSPPKITGSFVSAEPAQVNLDPSKGPSQPTTPPTRPFKGPSRPTTPILEPGRSSKLLASPQPPSPPPPRRSAELRRDRETRQPPGVPPPVNRAEKPANRLSQTVDNVPRPQPSRQAAGAHSPFHSPPTSASSPEPDEPPALPTRPANLTSEKIAAPKASTASASFVPPPTHHAIVSKRRGQEGNGSANLPMRTQSLAERPLAMAQRPQTVAVPPLSRSPTNPSMRPPPRPPRTNVVTSNMITEPVHQTSSPVSTTQGKRVSSTPTSQFTPPPTRTHGRSMTVSEKPPGEFREPPKRIGAVIPAASSAAPANLTSFPDSSNVNRRLPYIKGLGEIPSKYDTRVFDVFGRYVVTSGPVTRVWSLVDGELLMSFSLGEGVKTTAVSFKPTLQLDDEGTRIWIGNNIGEIVEADVMTQSVVSNRTSAHARHAVTKIFRHFNEMWTLDEGGTLHVWGPDSDGVPNLNNHPHQTFRLPRGQTFSMIVGERLWLATGKEIRIFAPTLDGRSQVQVLVRPMVTEGAGEVTSGTLIKSHPGKVFLGHSDGKVSIHSENDFSCLSVINVSTYKINALAGVGDDLWVGYNMGRICVYDINKSPWVVKKDWQAHKDQPVLKIKVDHASFYQMDRLQVISLGADNVLRLWDGLLQDDFIENEMKALDTQYCHFDDINAMVMTWNAGAATPATLRHSGSDATFIQNLLQSSGCPDILVFGFQELVDLEDKTATAKRFFKSKKKDPVTDQERMSHQYRDWRDFLIRSLDDYMPSDQLYHLLHSATLVGLFTCIFVKSTLRTRISNVSTAEVKRGMGGLHGNKGALLVRFVIDDTSCCFINCHLAAGQSHANARHADIAAIMDSEVFPQVRDPNVRIDSYSGGGDGTMPLDHELCLLNGDLNYRIDTMSRDTVVNAVKANNLGKLLDRDQLLVARRRNPGFRLRAFDEMPIEFAPTYKYDVGTDNYDSSEKKRSPAWCDRLLHRGSGRIQQFDYKRHEVRVSDHRPVTGQFRFTVKSVEPRARAIAWADCHQRFEDLRGKEALREKLNFLTNIRGYDLETSKRLLGE